MNKLVGTIQKKIYYNDENNYLIALFKVKSTDHVEFKSYINKTITVTGYVPPLTLEDTYSLQGNFTHHPRYGEQFIIDAYELITPNDAEGLIAFLSSDLFNGIGPATAKKVVEALGMNLTTDILKNNKILNKVDISEKHKETIIETLKLYQGSHQSILELTTLGFRLNDAILIYNQFKNNTSNILDNLYEIVLHIDSISFKRVDQIVKKHNLTYQTDTYQQVIILETVKQLTLGLGNTYTDMNSIHNLCYRYMSDEDIHSSIKYLTKHHYLYRQEKSIWLYSMHIDEMLVSDFFKQNDTRKFKNKHQLDNYHHLNSEQKQAITNAFTNRISIITGGPGTGKTTVIKSIVEIYKNNHPATNHYQLVLLAPTGKASKRMIYGTDHGASTIHRFLKWDKEQDSFGINIMNKSDAKMVIVDETSMIDTSLMASLIRGLDEDVNIVLVGDYHQLPSIRPGQVLKDLIDSNLIPTVTLTQIYRFDEGSNINVLGNAIINQDILQIKELGDNKSIIYHHIVDKDTKGYLIKELDHLLNQYLINDIAILIPRYATELGIDQINKMMSDHLLPDNKQIKYADTIFKEKDKVLLVNNLPDLNIFNGDIGYITNITNEKHVLIDFDGQLQDFKYADLKHLKLGYATSIHKSQGSEYKVVLIVINKHFKHMLNIELIYTAITRAKEKLYIIGDIELFFESLKANKHEKRLTMLQSMLSVK